MEINIPINKQARKYGYVYWKKENDDAIKQLLGSRDSINLIFMENNLDVKKIDWKNRRISIGYRNSRTLPVDYKYFALKLNNKGELVVKCR